MDKTQEILGTKSPYIKSMEHDPEKSEFILSLYNDPNSQKEYSLVVFPKVTEYNLKQHASEQTDTLDDVIGILNPEKNTYIITTQTCEVFLKCNPPVS